jgi:hypothetical protein
MENTNPLSSNLAKIPVVKFQTNRLDKIKNALTESAKRESEKSLGERSKENALSSSLYPIKAGQKSVNDAAVLALEVVTHPSETGKKIGTGIKDSYQTIKNSTKEEKLDWLTRKTIAAIESTPQQQAEALGYLAGDVLIGKGIAKGVKSASKLSKASTVIEKVTQAVANLEKKAVAPTLKNLSPEVPLENLKQIQKVKTPSRPDVIDDSLKFNFKQVQEKFKHAPVFGIEGNFSKKTAAQFTKAITQHIDDKSTLKILGTYRKDPAIHYFNPITKNNVILKMDGNFWSAWKLTDKKIEHLLKDGGI